jgi:hypothetical protein
MNILLLHLTVRTAISSVHQSLFLEPRVGMDCFVSPSALVTLILALSCTHLA